MGRGPSARTTPRHTARRRRRGAPRRRRLRGNGRRSRSRTPAPSPRSDSGCPRWPRGGSRETGPHRCVRPGSCPGPAAVRRRTPPPCHPERLPRASLLRGTPSLPRTRSTPTRRRREGAGPAGLSRSRGPRTRRRPGIDPSTAARPPPPRSEIRAATPPPRETSPSPPTSHDPSDPSRRARSARPRSAASGPGRELRAPSGPRAASTRARGSRTR